MIISDLNYLEVVGKLTKVEGSASLAKASVGGLAIGNNNATIYGEIKTVAIARDRYNLAISKSYAEGVAD